METEVKGLTEEDVEKLWDELVDIPEIPPGAMTRKQFAKRYGLKSDTATRRIEGLVKEGKLTRIGPLPGPSGAAAYYYYPVKK